MILQVYLYAANLKAFYHSYIFFLFLQFEPSGNFRVDLEEESCNLLLPGFSHLVNAL